jgi:hypothetical protein
MEMRFEGRKKAAGGREGRTAVRCPSRDVPPDQGVTGCRVTVAVFNEPDLLVEETSSEKGRRNEPYDISSPAA